MSLIERPIINLLKVLKIFCLTKVKSFCLCNNALAYKEDAGHQMPLDNEQIIYITSHLLPYT